MRYFNIIKSVTFVAFSAILTSCFEFEEKSYSNSGSIIVSATYTKYINSDDKSYLNVGLINNSQLVALSKGKVTFNNSELLLAWSSYGYVYTNIIQDSIVDGAKKILSIELDDKRNYNCELEFDKNYVKEIRCSSEWMADSSFKVTWSPPGANYITKLNYYLISNDNSVFPEIVSVDIGEKDTSYIFPSTLVKNETLYNSCDIQLNSIKKGTVDSRFRTESEFLGIFIANKKVTIKHD